MFLQADMSILDEIDSGLDIDALREVATAVNGLRTANTATLMVTHYQVQSYLTAARAHEPQNFYSLQSTSMLSSIQESLIIRNCGQASHTYANIVQRLLNYIKPDQVHVMESGRIIYSGGIEVAGVLENDGYEGVKKLVEEDKQPVAA